MGLCDWVARLFRSKWHAEFKADRERMDTQQETIERRLRRLNDEILGLEKEIENRYGILNAVTVKKDHRIVGSPCGNGLFTYGNREDHLRSSRQSASAAGYVYERDISSGVELWIKPDVQNTRQKCAKKGRKVGRKKGKLTKGVKK